MVKYTSNLAYFCVLLIYIDVNQYLDLFPLLLAAALHFATAGCVVKLRVVVLSSCDVYKDYIFVNDFVLKLLLFIYKMT